MDICLVPSLQHLSCSRIVISLLNKLLPSIDISRLCHSGATERYGYRKPPYDEDYKLIRKQVAKDLVHLSLCASIQKKLEEFIAPLYGEIEAWMKACSRIWTADDDALSVIKQSIPQCWSTVGVIDREKSAKSIVRNSHMPLTMRFIFACFYCVHEDVLVLWKRLTDREKTFLREEYHPKDFDFVVKRWIEWLEGWLNKDWPYCVAWILGTPLWDMNAYVLKRVLLALTPLERRHYVLKVALVDSATHVRESEEIRFCLSVITKEQREVALRDSPYEVIKCLSSWPLRTNILEIEDRFWSYLTPVTFYEILCLLVTQIRRHERDVSNELLVSLKYFWENSPVHFRNFAHSHRTIYSSPLQFVLKHDLSKVFPLWNFLHVFDGFLIPDDTHYDKASAIERRAISDFTLQSVEHSMSQSSLRCCVIL